MNCKRLFGLLAHLVEHLLCTQKVIGSTPIGSTIVSARVHGITCCDAEGGMVAAFYGGELVSIMCGDFFLRSGIWSGDLNRPTNQLIANVAKPRAFAPLAMVA